MASHQSCDRILVVHNRVWHKWWNKSSGKKILNTTFYPDQKGINKFINGKSELKGNKQVKTKNLKLENAKNIVRTTKKLCDQWMGSSIRLWIKNKGMPPNLCDHVSPLLCRCRWLTGGWQVYNRSILSRRSMYRFSPFFAPLFSGDSPPPS